MTEKRETRASGVVGFAPTARATSKDVLKELDALHRTTNAVKERMDSLEKTVRGGFKAVDQRFDAVDQRFDAVDKRFDSLEGEVRELAALVRRALLED